MLVAQLFLIGRSLKMIDDKIKNEILAEIPKNALKKWSEKDLFTEPAPRWFGLQKHEHDGVHYLVSIIVGKDERETAQMCDELIEWHKKYTKDQKEVRREESYFKKKY
jgi:hypothetical protein